MIFRESPAWLAPEDHSLQAKLPCWWEHPRSRGSQILRFTQNDKNTTTLLEGDPHSNLRGKWNSDGGSRTEEVAQSPRGPPELTETRDRRQGCASWISTEIRNVPRSNLRCGDIE